MPAEPLNESLGKAQRELELEQLAESLRAEAHHDWRQAALLVLSFDTEVIAKSSHLLRQGDEMTLTPLLEAQPVTAEQEVTAVQFLVEAQIRVRQILAAVQQLLNDRRRMPPPEKRGTPPETPPVIRRVCDEAYLLLRRMVHFSEDEDQYIFNSDAFLDLPEADRDQEIASVSAGQQWTVWVEPEAGEL